MYPASFAFVSIQLRAIAVVETPVAESDPGAESALLERRRLWLVDEEPAVGSHVAMPCPMQTRTMSRRQSRARRPVATHVATSSAHALRHCRASEDACACDAVTVRASTATS